MEHKKYDLITILGPTASGKTKLAVLLADKMDGEIVSADSRQVYKGMDIGTGKDLADYNIGERTIPYHLIDIADAGSKLNIFEYQQAFYSAYNEIKDRGKQAILCGGSGLYIEAVAEGYDLKPVPQNDELRKKLEAYTLEDLAHHLEKMKKVHNKSDFDTKKRAIRAIEIETYYQTNPHEKTSNPQLSNIYFGISIDREVRRQRISQRLHERLAQGLVEEVEELHKKGVSIDDLMYYGLEYKYVGSYLAKQLSYNDMVQGLEMAIHQFAKRQMTWFRGMERKGLSINWIDYSVPNDEKVELILNQLKS